MQVTQETDEARCVRLGTGPGTAPEVLRGLAQSGSVTVRAAVAMNAAAPPDADQLLARDNDERVRALLARKLAGQVADGTGPDRAERPLQETLAALVADKAIRVRAAIAEMVKQMPKAPRPLILLLARDAAGMVSDPVIRFSPILTPEDLLSLLARPPSSATAVSVAGRPNLSEAISDAISASADSAAIRELLSNPSAAIREATLDALISRAPSHVDWHAPLVSRPVLAPHAARALADIVAAELLDRLANRADMDPAVAVDLRHRSATRLAPPQPGRVPVAELAADAAWHEAHAMHADGCLTEAAVIAAVHQGEVLRAAAMLAVAANVALSVVDRATSLRSAKGVIALVWEAGFSMQAAGPLQAMLAHIAPSSILPAGPGGAFPLATEEMRWQLDCLKRTGR